MRTCSHLKPFWEGWFTRVLDPIQRGNHKCNELFVKLRQSMDMGRVLAILVATQLVVSPVWACCWASAGDPVWMKSEKAIIIWNAAKGVQHFIRQVDFDTNAKDFGFIVPLPSVPDFAVAKDEAFELLERIYQQERRSELKSASMTAEGAAGGVEVLKTEQVGDYKATVVRATDGDAMNRWFAENGFRSRPQMTEWLNHYTKKNWVFAALKYDAAWTSTTRTKAIRISFKTDKPHYPYKMPSDAFKPGWVRPLRLFVVASEGMDAKFAQEGKDWAGQRLWSGQLRGGPQAELARLVDLPGSEIPENPTMTVFANAEDETKYDEDLVFATTGDWTPWILGSLLVVGFLAWMATQHNRRKFVPNPA